METLNRNVAVFHRKTLRYLEEVKKSQSAGVTPLKSADRDRILSYTENLRAYLNYVIKQPETDEPESHPFMLEAPPKPEVADMDNLDLYEAQLLLIVILTENMNSQSSRMGSGYFSFDYNRIMAMLQKLDNLIIDFIDRQKILDMPETSPRYEGVTHGSRGIEPT